MCLDEIWTCLVSGKPCRNVCGCFKVNSNQLYLEYYIGTFAKSSITESFLIFLNRDFHSSVNNILAFKPRKISFEVEKIPEVEFFDRKSLFPKGNYSPVAFVKRPKMDGCAKQMVICRQVDGQRNILLSQKYHERPSSFRI